MRGGQWKDILIKKKRFFKNFYDLMIPVNSFIKFEYSSANLYSLKYIFL